MEADNTFKPKRPIGDSVFSKAEVDIIIPFHGLYEKVYQVVESVLLVTRSNPYRIILVDDGSPNEHFIGSFKRRKFTTHRSTKLIMMRNSEQKGFGAAARTGYEASTAPWVVFLNSDCVIEDSNWLIEMGRSLINLREENVRMVSARTDNPGLTSLDLLKGDRTHKIQDVILKEGEYLPLYCFMCHRELFPRIKGFIKEYPYGWYEDEELAYRMNRFGFKQAISGQSWVHHEGAATIKSVWKRTPIVKEIMQANRDRCLADLKLLYEGTK